MRDCGSAAGIVAEFIGSPDGRDTFEARQLAPRRLRARRRGARLQDLPCEVIELRGDVGVARQREWHARIERGGDSLVVARERMVNRVTERALDLLRWNRVRLG